MRDAQSSAPVIVTADLRGLSRLRSANPGAGVVIVAVRRAEVAAALDAGEAPAQVKRRLRMPSRAADALIADAGRRGTERLRQAVCEIADLELASRGGGSGGAGEDTAALLTLRRLAA